MQESQAQAARRWGLWKLLGNSGSSISSLGPPGAGRPRAGDTSASFLAWTCPHGPTPPPPALSAAPRVTVPRALAEASGTRSPWTCVRVPLCFQAHLEDAIPHLVGSQEWPEGTPRSEQVSHGRERGPDGDGGNSRALKALYCGLRGGGGGSCWPCAGLRTVEGGGGRVAWARQARVDTEDTCPSTLLSFGRRAAAPSRLPLALDVLWGTWSLLLAFLRLPCWPGALSVSPWGAEHPQGWARSPGSALPSHSSWSLSPQLHSYPGRAPPSPLAHTPCSLQGRAIEGSCPHTKLGAPRPEG